MVLENDQGHILSLEVGSRTWNIGTIVNCKGEIMTSTLWKGWNYKKSLLWLLLVAPKLLSIRREQELMFIVTQNVHNDPQDVNDDMSFPSWHFNIFRSQWQFRRLPQVPVWCHTHLFFMGPTQHPLDHGSNEPTRLFTWCHLGRPVIVSSFMNSFGHSSLQNLV